MRLAEALILRADAQKRIEQIRGRLSQNVKVQEGDTPAEEPMALLKELERAATDLTSLIQRINRTNVATALNEETNLADALATRDVLRLRHTAYRDLVQAASQQPGRYSRSEIRYINTVDVASLQRQADSLAQEYRLLDTRIQEANWQTDLVE